MEKPDSLSEKAGEVYGYVKFYIEQKVEYYRLAVIERLALTLSGLLTAFALVVLVSMVLLFGTIAVAFYLSHLLESEGHGFLIVAAFYLVLGIILFIFRRRLIMEPIINIVIQSVDEAEKQNEEDKEAEENETEKVKELSKP